MEKTHHQYLHQSGLLSSLDSQLHPSVQSSPHVAATGTDPPPAPIPDEDDISPTPPQQWHGWKIVGDNIDKSVKPRHEIVDHHTKSLQYFHSYAVLDRIDFSHYSDEPTTMDASLYSVESFLPTPDDLKQMFTNFTVLVSRILVEYLPCFQGFSKAVINHIPHLYTKQMSAKSKVVNINIPGLHPGFVTCCMIVCIYCMVAKDETWE